MATTLSPVEPGTTLEDPSQDTEVLATPDQTGDRYLLRLTVRPGGGPGLRGFGPHLHPGLTEIFRCPSGSMATRLGRTISTLRPGERLEVPPGVVHGFKNTENTDLTVDVDLVFTPPGPRPEADLLPIGLAISDAVAKGEVSRLTGYPPLLQMAVIERSHREAIRHPGFAGLIMPALASLGRLRGYKSSVDQDNY